MRDARAIPSRGGRTRAVPSARVREFHRARAMTVRTRRERETDDGVDGFARYVGVGEAFRR